MPLPYSGIIFGKQESKKDLEEIFVEERSLTEMGYK